MPLYDFRCQGCDAVTEMSMRVHEYEQRRDGGLECPKCQGRDLRPELSLFEVKTTRKSASWS